MRAISIGLIACAILAFWFSARNIGDVRFISPSAPFTAPAPNVTGVVVDAAGAPVPGAAVSLKLADASLRSTVSDAKGAFAFRGVALGPATLTVEHPAFESSGRDLQIEGARDVRVRVVLTPTPRVSAGKSVVGGVEDGVLGGVTGGIVGGLEAAPPPPPPPPSSGGQLAAAPRPAAAPIESPWYLARAGGSFNTASYDRIDDNAFHRVADEPLSTFSSDVDTASYSNVRRFLTSGRLPPPDAVRTEEFINYFKFDYPSPTADRPFSITTEVTVCPWNTGHRIALIGLQTRPIDVTTTPRNLVFLIDVSGSMMPPDRLPLVRTALRMLVDTLNEHDRLAIVVYAGASGLVLPSTPGNRKEQIHEAIARLEAGGSTNGAAGMQLAYDVAASSFLKNGINRVVLATDGDFNVGVTSQGDLIRLIERERERGVFLSVLGVGRDNLKDSTMQKLADKGNGNYSYLDSLQEARRVLVAEAGATLNTVAKDVKIQVEFNPAAVNAYRLIGYEKRVLRIEDFNNDRKDAGEIGAGRSVTALYEIVPAGTPIDLPSIDPLKYQREPRAARAGGDELMTIKVRYKKPDGETSQLMTVPVPSRTTGLSPRVGFAASVAQFGMLLRESAHKGTATWQQTVDLARTHRGTDPDGYRAEFARLVELAASLASQREAGTRR